MSPIIPSPFCSHKRCVEADIVPQTSLPHHLSTDGWISCELLHYNCEINNLHFPRYPSSTVKNFEKKTYLNPHEKWYTTKKLDSYVSVCVCVPPCTLAICPLSVRKIKPRTAALKIVPFSRVIAIFTLSCNFQYWKRPTGPPKITSCQYISLHLQINK